MNDFLPSLFYNGPFVPHGHCYLWTPGLLWLHVVSDALIVFSYFTIPITLLYFVRRRKDMRFSWMFVCFAVFIVACGTSHLMEIWNVWHGNYWLFGGVKAVTAMASVPTAFLLTRLVSPALKLPSMADLTKLNTVLEQEVAIHPDTSVSNEIAREHPEADSIPAPLRASNQNLAGIKVLVVDDEEDARSLIRRILQGCGALVKTAGSAAEALAAIETERPDVLVSDIGMPGENGYELLRRLRSLGPEKGGNTPALALTAYARSEDRIQAVRVGFQMHVAKPVEPTELLTMVASLAGRAGGA